MEKMTFPLNAPSLSPSKIDLAESPPVSRKMRRWRQERTAGMGKKGGSKRQAGRQRAQRSRDRDGEMLAQTEAEIKRERTTK